MTSSWFRACGSSPRAWLLAVALVPGCGDEGPGDETDVSDVAPDAADTEMPDQTTDTTDAADTTTDVVLDTADEQTPETSGEVLWQQLLAFAESRRRALELPGMQIAVVADRQLRYVGALGVREWFGHVPVTDATVFRWPVGSALVTALAAMRLDFELGKLDRHAPITTIIPELGLADGVDLGGMTLHHLLSNTSGLPPFAVPATGPPCELDLAPYYAAWRPQPLARAGDFVIDSVDNANLVGLAIEHAAHAPFADAMSALLFAPQGMHTATFDAAAAVASGDWANGAHGSGHDDAQLEPLLRVDCRAMRPSLFLNATATDVGKALELLMTFGARGPMLNAGDTRWHPDGSLRAGYALRCDTRYGGFGLCSAGWGTVTGFASAILVAPDRGFAIAVVINADWGKPDEILEYARELWLPELRPVGSSFTTDPKTWGKYAGTYDDPAHLGTIEVMANGASLWARFDDGASSFALELAQLAGDRFSLVHPEHREMAVLFGFDAWEPAAARWFVTDRGVAERRRDPIDPLADLWRIEDAAVVSSTCPDEVAAASGFLVIDRVRPDLGIGAFCADAAGTHCRDGQDVMPIEIDGGTITLDTSHEWAVEGYDCTVYVSGPGTLTLDGDRLDLAVTSTRRILAGEQCAEAEAYWQGLDGNTHALEGCQVSETIRMARYRRPEVTLETYPRVDGSTSTLPLARAIASELFGLPYHWTPPMNWGTSLELVPYGRTPTEEDLARAIADRVAHDEHTAYEGLVDGDSDLLLELSPPSRSVLDSAAYHGVRLIWTPIAREAVAFLASSSNPIAGLTSAQIRGIYSGALTRWSDVGGADADIHPYVPPRALESRQIMESLFMSGRSMPEWPEDCGTYKPSPFLALSSDPDGIGFGALYFVTYQFPIPDLKLLAVDGHLPSRDAIAAGTYPFTTPVWVVIRDGLDPDSPARRLRDWLLGPEGQRVVERSGYLPVPEPAPDGASPPSPEPTSCEPYLDDTGSLCSLGRERDNGGCPAHQFCSPNWDEQCNPVGRCQLLPGDLPGIGAFCAWFSWPYGSCGSGLVCSGGVWGTCRPFCDPWAESGEACAAGERCMKVSDLTIEYNPLWPNPLGFCVVPCTPGQMQCPVGKWCQPRELDTATDQWVGECTP